MPFVNSRTEKTDREWLELLGAERSGGFSGCLDQECVGIREQVGMQFQIDDGYGQVWIQEALCMTWADQQS